MRTPLLLLALGFPSAAGAAGPPAWPQFRGPGGTGVAPETARPPTRLDPDRNVKWKVGVPPGHSSPVVAGGRLFLTGYDEKKLYTLAYRLADGKRLWRRQAPGTTIEPFEKTTGSPAASTPATDGERLVVYFGSCGLICYDLEGKELWRHPLPIGKTQHGFGTGSSPVLADGRVVLLRDLEQGGELLCLDLAGGKRLWRADRAGCKTSWGSPCIWSTPAGKQVVVAGGLRLKGYNLTDGKERWTVSGLPSYPATTPVVADGRLVYAGWSYGGAAEFRSMMPSFDDLLKEAGERRLGYLTRAGLDKTQAKGGFDELDTNRDGKVTRVEWGAVVEYMTSGRNVAFVLNPNGMGKGIDSYVLWRREIQGLPYIPSPLVYRGLLYTVNKDGRLSAHEVKTGKEVYAARQVGLGNVFASPVAAAGHLYLCSLDESVIVVRAGKVPARV